MENRIALIGIIVSDMSQTGKINTILSGYQQYILGRMGLPHQHHNGEELAIISIAIEAPGDVISSLSGKLGMLEGITSKVIYHTLKTH
ncbi:MAG: iron-only hydrogenase system regulator [Lachnospiraceae bacterium]|nr:iron-only hydrogenase system regulator [Lachnospiraceae bacterium]